MGNDITLPHFQYRIRYFKDYFVLFFFSNFNNKKYSALLNKLYSGKTEGTKQK